MSNIKTGDILNFNYTGAVQSVTLPKGIYTLECWGAQGGNRSQDSASATVTGSGKPATMETGLVVNVPDFIEAGQKLIINTAEGTYVSRA